MDYSNSYNVLPGFSDDNQKTKLMLLLYNQISSRTQIVYSKENKIDIEQAKHDRNTDLKK